MLIIFFKLKLIDLLQSLLNLFIIFIRLGLRNNIFDM